MLRTPLIRLVAKCWTNRQWAAMSTRSDRREQFLEMKNALGETDFAQVVQNLVDLGFSQSERTCIMAQHPRVATYSLGKLQHQMEVLGSLGFKTEEIRDIMVGAPGILGLEDRHIKSNHHNLLLQMGNHHGRVAATSSPRTLVDSPLVTTEKIDYCIMKMGMAKPVIAKSRVLQCSLDLIRLRHTFAYRAGRYKMIDPKNKEGLPDNPHVKELFFSSDEEFLHLFKGLNMEDYVVFEALLASELEQDGTNDLLTEDDEEDSSGSSLPSDDDGKKKKRNKRR